MGRVGGGRNRYLKIIYFANSRLKKKSGTLMLWNFDRLLGEPSANSASLTDLNAVAI